MRLPDTPSPLFVVWRRPRNTRERWQKVPGLPPMNHDAAFKATIAEEWRASHTDWEYAIAPAGQMPDERRHVGGGRRGTFYEGYRTKEMKPQ